MNRQQEYKKTVEKIPKSLCREINLDNYFGYFNTDWNKAILVCWQTISFKKVRPHVRYHLFVPLSVFFSRQVLHM